ncbi:unnamed protein product [Tuber aestivum]|uniref:Uncharacterized protein n=1 Tax=Tuber aestivum TaxID=59557 RepID=A0A292PSD7_9PEZI|nr:unnamed protein product [Tuber aestivum]
MAITSKQSMLDSRGLVTSERLLLAYASIPMTVQYLAGPQSSQVGLGRISLISNVRFCAL